MSSNLFLFFTDQFMTLVFIFLIAVGIYFSLKSRFFQIRALGRVRQIFGSWDNSKVKTSDKEGISAAKALWTAMSTTIGIGNIFGPIVAIAFGGPGAVLAYFLASIFGAILTYTEVFLAISDRRLAPSGKVEGGPMCYIEKSLGSLASKAYGFFCAALLAAWSMSQSHTLSHMFVSWHVSPFALSIALAALVVVFLLLGLTWIADLNAKMVPLMFVLYAGSTTYIVGSHAALLPQIFSDIISGFFNLKSLGTGAASYSLFETLRWGFARAIQSNEAGVGTATIPHSHSKAATPGGQATLAMFSVYANGLICVLSALTVLVSDKYLPLDPETINVSIIVNIFDDHFSLAGQPLFFLIAFLFGFGTILGNAYNGSCCFSYITKERFSLAYILLVGAGVCAGGLIDLKSAWSVIDYFIVPVILINIVSILLAIRKKRPSIFS